MCDKKTRIADFYKGKCVFLTGASGYLGVVLLEILLRCCPGLERIYILLRGKKGVSPETRKEDLFKKSIFFKLRENHPDVFNKVHVIPGDTSLPDLGMSSKDMRTVIENTSIIFHMAASVSFMKPLRFTMSHNSRAVDYVIDVCKRLKKIEAFVITSTAFSNCNRNEIEEEIYRLPFPAQRFLDTLNEGSDDDLNYLVSQCRPNWPNNYTFSKCLGENIVLEKATGIPTVIIRPSIVVNCWKGACPGYIQEGSGVVDLGLAIGKGFVRVIPGNPDIGFDVIPVDIIANAHVVAAYKMACERLPSPMVVNCVSGEIANITLRKFADSLLKMSLKYPLPKSFQKPKVSYQAHNVLYWLISVYEHYAPAYIIDALLRLTGRKPRLVRLYRFYDFAMTSLRFFVTMEFNFHTQNFKSLAQVHPDDQEVFYTDVEGFSAESIAEVLPKGAPFYQWETDNKSIDERARLIQVRTMLTTFIRLSVLICIFSLAYAIAEISWRTISL